MVLTVENDGKSGPFCPGSPISYSLRSCFRKGDKCVKQQGINEVWW